MLSERMISSNGKRIPYPTNVIRDRGYAFSALRPKRSIAQVVLLRIVSAIALQPGLFP